MTVIAWDGTTLAADKRTGLGTFINTTTKIFRLDDNTFCGYTGNQDFGEQMVAWYKAGAKAEDFPASQRDKDDWARLIVVRSCTHIVPEPELPHANPLDLESLSAFTVVRYKTRKVMQDRYEVLEYERTPHPIRNEDKLRAWGSGRDDKRKRGTPSAAKNWASQKPTYRRFTKGWQMQSSRRSGGR